MKRGAVESPKIRRLSKRLGTGLASTVGHLELLWHFTAKQAPAGDVGRWADDEIAEACDWDGDPGAFVDALVMARWLDPCPCHRLIVHDWSEHADDALRKSMRRRDATARNVRYEESVAAFTRVAAEIPESSRPEWRAWIAAADNGGQRRTTADNGGHLPPSPPGPARPRQAEPSASRSRARARDEGQGNSQDHCTQPDAGAPALTTDRSLDTRTALHPDALRIADLWAKHRRQVDPKDPIVERGRWATDRETMAGTLMTHVERHGVDTVTAVIEWGMRHVDGEFSWQAQLDSPKSVEAALTKGRIVSQWRAAQEAAKRAAETGHVRSRRDARAPAELEAERQAREREVREREQREARWREEAAANPLTPELRDRIKRQVLGGGG